MAPCFPSQDAQLLTGNGSTTFVPTERILLASMMTLDDTDEILHVIHKSLRFECACLVIASSPVKYCLLRDTEMLFRVLKALLLDHRQYKE